MKKIWDIWQLFPRRIRKPLADAFRAISMYCKYIVYHVTHWRHPDIHKIPIIINNFNRLSFLQELIESLVSRGYDNIIILDNQSTYPPLLEWYETCPYHIIKLDRNYGFKAIWDSGVYDRFKRSYYVYTDSDVVIDKHCPDDFMERFLQILDQYPRCLKVGFGIRIDDIPDTFKMKDYVLEHENKFWEKPLQEGIYLAQVDTTFALYRPFCYGAANDHHMMIRTGFPYVIRHNPWYVDSSSLTNEERYYVEHSAQKTFWTGRTIADNKQTISET